MMTWDLDIVYALNGFVGHWPRFDDLIVAVADMHLAKGGVLAVLLWWAWYSGAPQARDKTLCGLTAGLLALGAARAMAHLLPFRLRPVVDAALGLHQAPGLEYAGERLWSAFPSDHAALFVTLAATLWMISRPVGTFALAHTLVIILLPRLYLGLHRPTDLLGGILVALLAIAAVWSSPRRHRAVAALLAWEQRQPAYFYPLLFLYIFQLSELFNSARYGMALLRRLLATAAT